MFAPPANFKVGFQSSKGNMTIAEFVPADQSVEACTEMLTVQVVRAVPDMAASFLQTVGSQYVQACPNTTANGIFTGNSNGYVVSMLVMKCPSNPAPGEPETTIFRVMRGSDALYAVQHAWRALIPDQDVDASMRALGNVTVCDTRTREHPCPTLSSASKTTPF